jgi:peptidoglycan/LPS O-acetylase OafA/YrhL
MHHYAANPWQASHHRSYTPASVLITACFVVMTLLALGKLDRLRWRGLTVLGTATYPLYLLHNVAGFTLVHALRQHLTAAPVWLLTGTLIALTGLALLVHQLVERPLASRLKAVLTRRTPRRPLPAAGAQAVRPGGPEPSSWGPHADPMARLRPDPTGT